MLQMHMIKKVFDWIKATKPGQWMFFRSLELVMLKKESHKNGSNRSCTERARHSHSRDEKDSNEQEADSRKLEDARSFNGMEHRSKAGRNWNTD